MWLFVDNVGAECAIRKGSTVADMNGVCAAIWKVAYRMGITLEVFRVPSKQNAADAPSRRLVPWPGPSVDVRSEAAPSAGVSYVWAVLREVPSDLQWFSEP